MSGLVVLSVQSCSSHWNIKESIWPASSSVTSERFINPVEPAGSVQGVSVRQVHLLGSSVVLLVWAEGKIRMLMRLYHPEKQHVTANIIILIYCTTISYMIMIKHYIYSTHSENLISSWPWLSVLFKSPFVVLE